MSEVPVSEQLCGFVDDLERTLSFEVGRTYDCDSILLCGVGGSAVSGDFAADCCLEESRVPIRLVKYPDLPAWAGTRTLAVVSSYSGNTAETLEMRRQAKERGCTVVAVTSGGELMRLSEEDGDFVARLPVGMQPRHAIGYMIGYTLAVIRAAGGPDLSGRIRGFIPSLRAYRDEVSVGDSCLARRLAAEFRGRVPVVCSDPCMSSVVFRWKTQINENAKFVAFCDTVPAFTRHGLDAWCSTERGDYLLVVLRGQPSEGLDVAVDRLSREGAPFTCIELGGGSSLEDMFRAIVLGDYISVFMARDRGIDPAEVRPVMQMKRKLASVLGSRRGRPRTP